MQLPVPDIWPIVLDQNEWDGCCLEGTCHFAIFNSEELWIRLAPGDQPVLEDIVEGVQQAAVVMDQSMSQNQGRGKDRTLHWTVSVLDPCSSNIFACARRAENRSPKVNKRLSQQLAGRLQAAGFIVDNDKNGC